MHELMTSGSHLNHWQHCAFTHYEKVDFYLPLATHAGKAVPYESLAHPHEGMTFQYEGMAPPC